VWRIGEDAAFEVRAWDETAVIFDRRDQRTQYLNVVSLQILRALQSQPRTTRDLVDTLQKQLDVPFDDADSAKVEAILNQLAALNLIEKFN